MAATSMEARCPCGGTFSVTYQGADAEARSSASSNLRAFLLRHAGHVPREAARGGDDLRVIRALLEGYLAGEGAQRQVGIEGGRPVMELSSRLEEARRLGGLTP